MESTRKVLIVGTVELMVGGIEAYIANAVTHMDQADIQVDIFWPGRLSKNPYIDICRDCGCTIYEYPLHKARLYRFFEMGIKLYKFLCRHPYDVVDSHVNLFEADAMIMFVSRLCGIPCRIVHSHFYIPEKKRIGEAVYNIFREAIVRNATDLLGCSRLAAEYRFGKRGAKWAVIARNGIDTYKFRFRSEVRERQRKRLGLEDCFVLGHVGRFSEQKNHRFLVEVFKNIAGREPAARLLSIGAGPLEEEIYRLVDSEQLTGRVIFVGTTNAVEDYMCAMDVFVLPSKFEGLPIVGVEAQTSGLPCILSDAITEETAVTDYAKFLSLSLGPEQWADEILKCRTQRPDREGAWRSVYDAGYDVSAAMQDLYGVYTKYPIKK